MKKIRRITCAVLTGVLLCTILAAAVQGKRYDTDEEPESKVPVLEIEAETENEHTMKVGEQVQLVVVRSETDEEDETDDSGESGSAGDDSTDGSDGEQGNGSDWNSADPDIVSVDENGVVTALRESEESVRVSCRVPEGVASCKITVEGYAVKEIKLTAKETMEVGETQKLTAEILPEEAAEDAELTWSSSEESILKIDQDGNVTAVGAGEAEITVTADGVSASVTIKVKEGKPVLKGIELVPDHIAIYSGQSKDIYLRADPKEADVGKVEWKSGNEGIAYYRNGKVYGRSAGETTITAILENGMKAQCRVTVKPGTMTLQPKNVTLQIGAGRTLKVIFDPADMEREVTWKTSNGAVARVTQNGTVIGVGKGSAVITASANGMQAVCAVTVVSSSPDKPTDGTGIPGTTGTIGTPDSSYTGGVITIPGAVIPMDFLYTMPTHIPDMAFLTIDSDLGPETENILNTLTTYRMSAGFFVPIDDLYAADDTLRHIAGGGNSIGFLLTRDQASAADVVDVLEKANAKLSVITGTPTYLIRIIGGSAGNLTSEQATRLTDAGYRIWDWQYAANEDTTTADAAYERLCSVMDATGTVTVRFGSGVNTAPVLDQLLPFLKYCAIPVQAISAADIPVCNTAVG